MRLVGDDERPPDGSVSYAVIIEDLTRVRNQVIELEAEAERIPGGENIRNQLAQLRVFVEIVLGVATAELAAIEGE